MGRPDHLILSLSTNRNLFGATAVHGPFPDFFRRPWKTNSRRSSDSQEISSFWFGSTAMGSKTISIRWNSSLRSFPTRIWTFRTQPALASGLRGTSSPDSWTGCTQSGTGPFHQPRVSENDATASPRVATTDLNTKRVGDGNRELIPERIDPSASATLCPLFPCWKQILDFFLPEHVPTANSLLSFSYAGVCRRFPAPATVFERFPI